MKIGTIRSRVARGARVAGRHPPGCRHRMSIAARRPPTCVGRTHGRGRRGGARCACQRARDRRHGSDQLRIEGHAHRTRPRRCARGDRRPRQPAPPHQHVDQRRGRAGLRERAVPSRRAAGRVRESAQPGDLPEPKPHADDQGSGVGQREGRARMAQGVGQPRRDVARPPCALHGQRRAAGGPSATPTPVTSSTGGSCRCTTAGTRSAARSAARSRGCRRRRRGRRCCSPWWWRRWSSDSAAPATGARSSPSGPGCSSPARSSHAIGNWAESSATFGTKASESIYSIVGIGLGVLALGWMWRRGADAAVPFVLVASVFLLVAGGLADVSTLGHSQVPSSLPPVIARIVVACTIGLGVGLAATAGMRLRVISPPRPPRPPRDAVRAGAPGARRSPVDFGAPFVVVGLHLDRGVFDPAPFEQHAAPGRARRAGRWSA